MGICVVCQAAVVMFLPSMPSMQTDLNASQGAVQATLSAFLAAFAGTQIFIGPLSDRLGRRRVLIVGLTLFTLGSVLCTLAPSVDWLIAARVLQGAGACTGVVMSRAIVRDLAVGPMAARAIAMIASALATAPAVAPLIGGQVHAWLGWRGNFAVMAVFAAIILVSSIRLLPATGGGLPRGFFNGYGELFRNRTFMGYLGGITFGTATFYSFVGASAPLLIEVLHLPVGAFGLITLMWAGAFVVGAQIIARWGGRLGQSRMIFTGTGMSLGAALVMAALAHAGVNHILAIAIPLFFIGLGNGLNMPNGSVRALNAAPARIAGAASATIGFSQMGLGGIITWLMGHVEHATALPMSLAIAGFGVMAIVSYLLAGRAANSVTP